MKKAILKLAVVGISALSANMAMAADFDHNSYVAVVCHSANRIEDAAATINLETIAGKNLSGEYSTVPLERRREHPQSWHVFAFSPCTGTANAKSDQFA